jgi:ankyrin repeat protein
MAGDTATTPDWDSGLRAARQGDTDYLGKWLAAGNDPNRRDREGWTPLLWAAVRGHQAAVELLLDNLPARADVALGHGVSGALPIHFAGHSGSVAVAEALLHRRPDHLDAVWDLNGHTVLLQAVFYGHRELAAAMLSRGASTSITTARGLGPMELATQFQNRSMMDIIRPYDTPAQAKADYYRTYLARIAVPVSPAEKPAQALSDELIKVIESGIRNAAHDPKAVDATLAAVRALVEERYADVNRLGGPLGQPPLVVVVTGNNGEPANADMERLRNELAAYLLERGADPARHERHPMGAQTIIRAAVFNHLDILKMCAHHMSAKALAAALNEIPVVNGLTALHDTVLRATMAGPDRIEGYLAQTRWAVLAGARSDIEDFSGRTQRDLAEQAADPALRARLLAILAQA